MAHLTKEGMKNIALACKEAVEAHEEKYGKDFPFEQQSSWQGLSDDEIEQAILSKNKEGAWWGMCLDIARAIEQALKEKNNG